MTHVSEARVEESIEWQIGRMSGKARAQRLKLMQRSNLSRGLVLKPLDGKRGDGLAREHLLFISSLRSLLPAVAASCAAAPCMH